MRSQFREAQDFPVAADVRRRTTHSSDRNRKHDAAPPPDVGGYEICLVAIVGGSGAGKSWLARKLQTALGSKATRISLDDFYRDHSRIPPARRVNINFDHPRAIDWPAVEQAGRGLRDGRVVRLPRYDFKTHCRLREENILAPRPIVLMEGLWLLRRPSLRRLFDWRIFIDCPAPLRRRRRLARDLRSRGRTRASVRRQFRET